MTKVQTNRDLITARGASIPGIPVPSDLKGRMIDDLRYDGQSVIDPAERTTWAIDAAGRKRLPEMADPDWPVLSCAWSDVIRRGADGAWRVETEAERELRETPDLDPTQWAFLLDLTGFGDAVDAALAALPKETPEDRTTWAGMRAVAQGRAGASLGNTLRLVAKVRGMELPDVVTPTDDEIRAAWGQALDFQGAADL